MENGSRTYQDPERRAVSLQSTIEPRPDHPQHGWEEAKGDRTQARETSG